MHTHKRFFSNQDITPAHIAFSQDIDICKLSGTHLHETIEILYTIKGAILCSHNAGEVELKKGEIIFFNSNVPHKTQCLQNGTDCALFQFHPPTFSTHPLSYLNEFLHINNTPFHVFTSDDQDYEELKDCLDNMLTASMNTDVTSDYYLISNLFIIFAIFSRRGFISVTENDVTANLINKIMPFFEYVDKNYADPISLDDMAKSVNFHKEYFCRLFKQATGNTTIDYLHFVRVYKAEQLLKAGVSATDVAYRVGFTSASYFAKVFKKFRQCSPSTFKKLHTYPEKLFFDAKLNDI